MEEKLSILPEYVQQNIDNNNVVGPNFSKGLIDFKGIAFEVLFENQTNDKL